jgi:hypothetical protein
MDRSCFGLVAMGSKWFRKGQQGMQTRGGWQLTACQGYLGLQPADDCPHSPAVFHPTSYELLFDAQAFDLLQDEEVWVGNAGAVVQQQETVCSAKPPSIRPKV